MLKSPKNTKNKFKWAISYKLSLKNPNFHSLKDSKHSCVTDPKIVALKKFKTKLVKSPSRKYVTKPKVHDLIGYRSNNILHEASHITKPEWENYRIKDLKLRKGQLRRTELKKLKKLKKLQIKTPELSEEIETSIEEEIYRQMIRKKTPDLVKKNINKKTLGNEQVKKQTDLKESESTTLVNVYDNESQAVVSDRKPTEAKEYIKVDNTKELSKGRLIIKKIINKDSTVSFENVTPGKDNSKDDTGDSVKYPNLKGLFFKKRRDRQKINFQTKINKLTNIFQKERLIFLRCFKKLI